MGRTSEYKKEQSEEEIAKEVESLMYKEPLSAKQMAAYLSKHSRGKIHFDERKVRNRINDICELSDGRIEPKDFVKNPKVKKSKYLFKPEWQGLLMALMDTSYFDDRKNDRLLSTREKLYRDLTVNIDLYLDDRDKEIVKSYPGYKLACCEGKASEAISYDMQSLMRTAMHADETIRLKLLRNIHDVLTELNEKNNRMCSQIFANKLVYKSNLDNGYLAKMYSAESLPLFMVELLALKVKEKQYSKYVDGGVLTYDKLYETARIDEPLELPSQEDCDIFIREINERLDETKHYKDMMERIERIIDKDDPIERMLYRDFEYITRNRFIMEALDRTEAKKYKDFIESSMQQDMYDLLNMFLNVEDLNTPLVIELSRIRGMKPIMENKKKTEN